MSPPSPPPPFVSRGGEKLAAALDHFNLTVEQRICADLGSHVGGFVDCLLRRGASRVYAIDTAYGILAWRLRKDPRIVVLERTNAMHVELPELVDVVTIDVGWTPQAKVLPNVSRLIRPDGHVLALIKPHYEASKEQLVAGVLPGEDLDETVRMVCCGMVSLGWTVAGTLLSPIRGHGGNREVFALLRRNHPTINGNVSRRG